MNQLTDPKPAKPEWLESGFCQVEDCYNPRTDEPVEVFLQRKDGSEFLFTAKFCRMHKKMFSIAAGILAAYIYEGKIQGIDPSILKGAE